MRLPLKLHPMSHSGAVRAIDAQVDRSGDRLTVTYRLEGRMAEVIVPQSAAPVRADELWRHTCFEAFVDDGTGGYAEFNFAPSGQWAAYGFEAYRRGMRPLDVAAPEIRMATTDVALELTAAFVAPQATRLGLSAVIEQAGGGVSYWALSHPPGKPDFHHADCFALDLAASQRP